MESVGAEITEALKLVRKLGFCKFPLVALLTFYFIQQCFRLQLFSMWDALKGVTAMFDHLGGKVETGQTVNKSSHENI
jgi:hypothetical protein